MYPNTKDGITIGFTGNVGVGTTVPTAPLHVYKAGNYPEVYVDYSGGQHMSMLTGTTGSGLGYSGFLSIGTITGSQQTGWAEKIRIEASGNMGIGTTSTMNAFQVGSSTFSVSLISGNVGIGTSIPMKALDVLGNVGVTGTVYAGAPGDTQSVRVRGYGTSETNWKGGAAFGGSGASVIMGELNSVSQIGGHSASLSAWQDLAINSAGGNVGIGTTVPAAKLDVAGTIKSQNLVYKTADENVLNSTTLQDDDHLKFSMKASTKYQFAMTVIGNSIVGAGIKLSVNGPASPANVEVTFRGSAAGANTITATSVYTGNLTTYDSAMDMGTGGVIVWQISGTIENGSTAGNLVLRFAQAAQHASLNATIYKGSYLIYNEVP